MLTFLSVFEAEMEEVSFREREQHQTRPDDGVRVKPHPVMSFHDFSHEHRGMFSFFEDCHSDEPT